MCGRYSHAKLSPNKPHQKTHTAKKHTTAAARFVEARHGSCDGQGDAKSKGSERKQSVVMATKFRRVCVSVMAAEGGGLFGTAAVSKRQSSIRV